MPTKKQIITIGVLCVIALGLGYWSGMPEKGSGQGAEVVAPTIVTNVVTNIVVAPEPTPPPPPAIAKPKPSPKPNPITPADEKLIADHIVEQAVRRSLNKPEGELTEADLEKVTFFDLEGSCTDEGLKEVAKLQNLEGLTLHNTQITDEGLKEVAKLQKLRYLDLSYTRITGAGVAKLKKALSPYCRIIR